MDMHVGVEFVIMLVGSWWVHWAHSKDASGAKLAGIMVSILSGVWI